MEWTFKKGQLDSFARNRVFLGDPSGENVGYELPR